MKAKNILVGVIVAICAGTINIGYAVTPKYVTSSHTSITKASLEYYRNIEVSFSTITDSDISNMAIGSYDEDASPLYTRAFNHFYDYYHRNNNGGGFYYQYDSAKQWAHDKARQSEGIYGGDFTWETAIYNYKAQNYSEAFFGLGHILHLIQDMCVPTHTRNDIHVGPINLLGEYEIYVDNWINDNKNNVASILSGDHSILEFNSIDEYFDYLSNYTQRNFYSGFSDAGTVFSMDYSENGNIFPSWTQKKDELIYGETFYFAYGKDPEGSGEIHLAYRVYKVPLTGWELWSAEHQAVHKDTWKRAGKLAMSATAGVVKLFLKEAASIQPGSVSVNPASGNWTTTPQNLAISSTNATAIYYTMVITTDGTTPADPREPTSTDNDGSVPVSGNAGAFQLYATAGQNKQTKLRFKGYNSAGAGPASVVYSYNINLSGTSPLPTWTKTYGGAFFDQAYGVQQTSDGGYIIAGITASSSFSETNDVYLVKTDSSGNTLWSKTYGGTNSDYARAVQQTSDGGYIIAGDTFSFGAGSGDVYLIKTDSSGNTLWSKTYGGTNEDSARGVQQTSDGGYIVVGTTMSLGGSFYDVYLIKTDSSGNATWTKTFGGAAYDFGYAVRQTSDGGYIIAGSTMSFGAGSYDVYLIKTDASGNTLWTKTYGGTGSDQAYAVQQTSDGGYIVAGLTWSSGAGSCDVYLVKTDSSGNTLWTKTYGGTGIDQAYAVQQTSDGGYIVAGLTYSFGAGSYDVYLVKTDSSGNTLWLKTYGGTGSDQAFAVQQTSDGGYIVAGITDSFGAGGSDAYLIKTDSNGNVGGTPSTVTISVSPVSTTLAPGAIQQFAATVTGTTNTSVTWNIQEGSAGGTITSGGLYTAPSTPGTYHVVVTSQAENTKSATAVVTVTTPTTNYTLAVNAANGTVVKNPNQASYASGTSVQLTATANSGYTFTGWSGDITGTANPVTATMNSNKTIAANFALSPTITGWTKTYGGTGNEDAYAVQQTTDGGYIVAGLTFSFGAGDADAYLIKTDANGNTLWTKTFGGTGYDTANAVRQTADGGYIVAGYTQSFGAGNGDVYLIKTDANGNTLWTKTFGGTGWDLAYAVQQTTDGGYIVAGLTLSFGAGASDVYLIKTDANGNTLWTKTFGGTAVDYATAVQQTMDGGYIVAGITNSFGAGNADAYLIKADTNGNTLWTKTFGGTDYDTAYAVRQTADGGYIVAGGTVSFGAGTGDMYLIKTDASGNVN